MEDGQSQHEVLPASSVSQFSSTAQRTSTTSKSKTKISHIWDYMNFVKEIKKDRKTVAKVYK
ncbi:hypothetical protein PsorP6_006769 [Peronosclerospora sorghi]|uniref:Uncharacterized protein n=1 Tax=Peronosclerospora sorghi TaxID=230839 RepID=A0ACC0W7R1_9STRA|nr:hypothetical protein PsorP6_006769 [Peronosclerospora sorghi]